MTSLSMKKSLPSPPFLQSLSLFSLFAYVLGQEKNFDKVTAAVAAAAAAAADTAVILPYLRAKQPFA